MRLNILIGGKAGQGINKISEIVSKVLVRYGYFIFNYRDYPSLIRGGHNFNILSVSNKRVGSYESKLDVIVAMDEKTLEIHKGELKKEGVIINVKGFEDLGKNLNVAQSGALIKILSLEKEILIKEIKEQFDNEDSNKAAEQGFDSQEKKFDLGKLDNKVSIMTGSQAVAEGAVNSGINLYIAYPMTPATGVLHELAERASKPFKDGSGKIRVFQAENEIAVVNSGLGASFAGARVMVGTSGGGYDLMTEGLSLQGQSEIPLVVYLASRPGPGTGVPTYSSQADLDIALRGGHGEFPRVVIAPGDPIECIEKTNEAFYLSEKFECLSIILSDKHLAESEFSFDRKSNKIITIMNKRKLPGQAIVKASSYEHDKFGNTTEDAELTKQGADRRLAKYEEISKECDKFEMIKIFGNKNSKNLIIGWGSNKGVILDAIEGLDYKFLQVLYMKPLSDKIEKEILGVKKRGGKIIIVENNVTGQLSRAIREKSGLKINNRILKYDGRPFSSNELRRKIERVR